MPHLEDLELENNPLTYFSNNTFTKLTSISLPGTSIVDFDGNNLPHISELDMSKHTGLTSFENNRLDDLTKFSITQTLIDFNDNYLPKTSAFNISSFTVIQNFHGNTINVDTLFLESETLETFYDNTFPTITEATINRSNLLKIEFENCELLTTLTIRDSPKLETLKLNNLPKLSHLNLDAPSLLYLYIKNVNITVFPLNTTTLLTTTATFSLIKNLTLEDSPIANCDLSTFNALQHLNLSNIPISDLNLIDGDENNLISVWFQNLNIQNFSNHNLPDLLDLVLVDNLRLEIFTYNNMPYLINWRIVGGSVLKEVHDNSHTDLRKMSFINSKDAKIILNEIPKYYITGLELINNGLNNGDINFTEF